MRQFFPLPSGFVRSRACLRLFRSRAAFLQDYRLLKLHMEVFGLAITSNRLAVSCQARFVKQLALFCKWANADRVDLLQAALAVYLVRSSISMHATLAKRHHQIHLPLSCAGLHRLVPRA